MSESGRVAQLLQNSRACMEATALARARAVVGAPCGGCTTLADLSNARVEVPQSGSLLTQRIANCAAVGFVSPYECVPESVRVLREERKTLDAFAALGQFPKFFPTPCPPLPEFYTNAGQPFLQGKNCPLPNKPDNPVLPG